MDRIEISMIIGAVAVMAGSAAVASTGGGHITASPEPAAEQAQVQLALLASRGGGKASASRSSASRGGTRAGGGNRGASNRAGASSARSAAGNRRASDRPSTRPANVSGDRNAVRRDANVNINRDVRRDVNINRDVNIDVDHHYRGGYYRGGSYHRYYHYNGGRYGWYDDHNHFHPILTALAIGTIVATLPSNCTTVVINGIGYRQCGTVWYQPQYAGSNVTYVVINQPG